MILLVPALLVELSVFTYNSHWFQAPRGTLPVMGAMMMVLPGTIGIYVHIRAVWSLSNSLSVSSAVMFSQIFWKRVGSYCDPGARTLVVPRWLNWELSLFSGCHVAHCS